MPIYDYKCTSCGNETSHKKMMDERHNTEQDVCEECESLGTYKLIIKEAPILGYNVKTPGMKTSDSFNSRMKDIHKSRGKHSTMSDAIK